jgi:hypothetical protein
MLPTRRSDLEVRIVDDEAVILDLANGKIHRLNATATCIWSDCDGRTSPPEMATHLAASFRSTPEGVLADVMAILANLEELGLLAV